eukprot:scaffold62423_cov30-Tisochrysis_lutea.AAC.5
MGMGASRPPQVARSVERGSREASLHVHTVVNASAAPTAGMPPSSCCPQALWAITSRHRVSTGLLRVVVLMLSYIIVIMCTASLRPPSRHERPRASPGCRVLSGAPCYRTAPPPSVPVPPTPDVSMCSSMRFNIFPLLHSQPHSHSPSLSPNHSFY